MEADFLRDYGIDLVKELPKMTWRRFLVLYRNLNPFGAVSNRVQAEMAEAKQKESEESAEEQANAFFSQILSVNTPMRG